MRYRLVKVFVWQDRLPKNVVDVGGDLQASLVLAHPKYGGSIAGKPSDRDPPSKFIFGDGSSIQFVRLAFQRSSTMLRLMPASSLWVKGCKVSCLDRRVRGFWPSRPYLLIEAEPVKMKRGESLAIPSTRSFTASGSPGILCASSTMAGMGRSEIHDSRSLEARRNVFRLQA